MIEITNLQKVVNQQTVIDIENLIVGSGEIAGLTGDVDSGLDMLFDLLLGQISPTLGSIRLIDIDPVEDRDGFSQHVGVQFAIDNLYIRQSAQSNLDFFSNLYRLPRERVNDVLSKIGLADHAGTKVEDLSSSFTRRLGFGRAILHQPEVLLLNDPFLKCDHDSITLLTKLIRQEASQGHAVMVLAEDIDHLKGVCDVIYHFERGRITQIYKPDEEQAGEFPFMIPSKMEDKVALIDPADVLFIVAQDDRTYLQTKDEQLPTQFTLSELEKRLSARGFFRAHRSYLVNLQQVKEVIPFTRDSFTLRLKDSEGTQIPLSKSAARELRELLGY
jgi:ABC-2 type transport system ATP-binding protein